MVLFTGPSLHPDKARSLLANGATVLPPIKRGDLERLPSPGPAIIGIVDGEFYQSLAISPKEILPLLDNGIKVYGASSMGALRAVELRNCGMIGVGRVFRLFRRGTLDSDDEVALTYDPFTYEPVSEPLVNTRYLLRAAVRRNILTRSQAAEIVTRLKRIYFPERTKHLLLSIVRELIGNEGASRMREFFSDGAPNVKEEDAQLLIARMRTDIGTSDEL